MSDPGAPPAPPPRYVHGLFCDQVRDEVGGTQTYVGVYGPQLTLAFPPPFLVATLAAVTWVVAPIDDQIGNMAMRLHLPDGQVMEVGQDIPPPHFLPVTPESRQRIAAVVLRINNLMIQQAGRLWLEVIVDGTSWVGANLRITVQAAGTLIQAVSSSS